MATVIKPSKDPAPNGQTAAEREAAEAARAATSLEPERFPWGVIPMEIGWFPTAAEDGAGQG